MPRTGWKQKQKQKRSLRVSLREILSPWCMSLYSFCKTVPLLTILFHRSVSMTIDFSKRRSRWKSPINRSIPSPLLSDLPRTCGSRSWSLVDRTPSWTIGVVALVTEHPRDTLKST
jgi:hypothetical protein